MLVMMPIFFEPTAKKRELSLVAAGRSRSFGTLGKPKAAIWRPPRHLGSKRKHHTALAGVPRRGDFSSPAYSRVILEGFSPEGDSWRESRKVARRKPSRYGARGIRILALNRNEEKHGFAPSRKKIKVLTVDGHEGHSQSSSFLCFFLLIPFPSHEIVPSERSGEGTPGGFH